ncbi:hypothetical protein C8J57DRAFT_1229483 [Mycena rebaudengoi]|nr:hypothetical protein C8J57DRAFT_1229483 [Mycena rebaudengoi]
MRCVPSLAILVGINNDFWNRDQKVSDFETGDANIHQEITSETNPLFVLHDSKGFEPTDLSTFNVVHDFLLEKSNDDLELKDRLHAVWLCVRTPIAGARVLETADEALPKVAHEHKIPVVIVFTQYDLLVRMHMEDAAKAEFNPFVQSLKKAVERLAIEMISYINVAVPRKKRSGINISELVDMTCETVENHLQDVWVLWATAHRFSVPPKVKVSIEKGMDCGYPESFFTSPPKLILSKIFGALWGGLFPPLEIICFTIVSSRFIKTSLHAGTSRMQIRWVRFLTPGARNERGFFYQVLNGEEFKHLILSLVQEMQEEGGHKNPSPPDIEKINNFVGLCTAGSASAAPPGAILGLTYLFVYWMLRSPLENVPNVRRVLIAYTVDLILVLQELFDIALQFKLMGAGPGRNFGTHLRRITIEHLSTTSTRRRGSDLVGVRKNVEELVKKYGHSMRSLRNPWFNSQWCHFDIATALNQGSQPFFTYCRPRLRQ